MHAGGSTEMAEALLDLGSALPSTWALQHRGGWNASFIPAPCAHPSHPHSPSLSLPGPRSIQCRTRPLAGSRSTPSCTWQGLSSLRACPASGICSCMHGCVAWATGISCGPDCVMTACTHWLASRRPSSSRAAACGCGVAIRLCRTLPTVHRTAVSCIATSVKDHCRLHCMPHSR